MDLVLLVLRLPDGSGLYLLRKIGETSIDTAVVVLSGDLECQTAQEALAAGAVVGYIPKTEPSENVAGALGLVLADADGIADEILHGATGHSPLASSMQGRRGITRRVRPDERRSSAELNLAKNIVFQYAI